MTLPAVYSLPVVARPLASVGTSGRPGGYGLWEATVTLPGGGIATGGGCTEQRAVSNARQRAGRMLNSGKGVTS